MNSNFYLFLFTLLLLTNADDSVLSNQFITNYFTDNDFSAWTIFGNNIPPDHFFTQCGSQRIFGGYKKFGGDQTLPLKISRLYSGLIAHYAVRIQAKIYKIDSWNGQSLFVMADNVAQRIYTFDQTNSTLNICGDPNPTIDSINTNFNDSIFSVDLNISHTSSSLTVGFQTNLNSDRGWWGVRQIKVTLFLCDKSCKSCTNSSACVLCESAITGLTLIGAYCQCTGGSIKQLITTCTAMPCVRCVPGCSAGYYNNGVTGRCQSCHPACLTCSVASNTVSPACNPCAMGYFRVNPLAQPCYNCLGGCSACTALSSSACTSCKQGYFLWANQCLTSCPSGTYSQQNTRLCNLCSGSCNTCDGITSFHCTSCTGILYLNPNNQCLPSCNPPYYKYNNVCYQQCPIGTFSDSVLLTCNPCSTNCQQCQSSTSCTKCYSNYYLLGSNCVSNCPTTHYPSSVLGQCMICHTDCLQCFGASSSSCKVCSDANKILINGTCYSSCPNGTYSAMCLPCYETCLQCSGPLQTNCLSCPSLFFLDLTNNKCVEVCDIGMLVDKVAFTCQKCPNSMVSYFHQCVLCNPTCKTCYGTNFMECSTCETGYNIYETTCIHTNSQNQKIIKSSASQMNTQPIEIMFLVILASLCVFLQIFFTYKTALLPTIQFIQILSYFYFLSISMSEEVQSILQLFYYTNFSSLLSVDFGVVAKDIPLKITLMKKTGFYAIDTFGIHIIMIVVIFILILLKKIKSLSRIVDFAYDKLNPYLATYLYRLIILDQFFSLIIYLKYGGIDTPIGIASMSLLCLDVVIICLTGFWKIKPIRNQQNKQYALFYFNQIQQKYQITDQNQRNQRNQNQNNNKNNLKSTLLSFIFYVGKVPFPLAIVYFINNGTYQAIAICGYSSFFFIMLLLLPYKRKIYKFLYSLSGIFLIISSALYIGMIKNEDLSIGLQIVWMLYFMIVLTITFVQFLINYRLFIYFFKYLTHNIGELFKQQNQDLNQTEASQIDQSIKSTKSNDLKKQKQSKQQKKQNSQPKQQQKPNQLSNKKDNSLKIIDSQEEVQTQVKEQISQHQYQEQNFTEVYNQKQQPKSKTRNFQNQNQLHSHQLYSNTELSPKQNQQNQSDQGDIQLDIDL